MKFSLAAALLTHSLLCTVVQGQLLEVTKCTADEPCGECQADCTRDSDCEGDLVCFQQLGKSLDRGPIPGCKVVGTSFYALTGNIYLSTIVDNFTFDSILYLYYCRLLQE